MPKQRVIIEGNTIDNGNGVGVYSSCLYLNAPVILRNNSITAYTSSNGFDLSAGGTTDHNESIISGNVFECSSVNGSTLLGTVTSPATISDNVFSGASAGISPTTAFLLVSANSTILGNTFKYPNTTTFLTLSNCQCIVRNNRFTRGATSISSYINISGSSGHQITDNVFDSSTTDGSTETLAANLVDGDLFTRNKSQIEYMSILPTADNFFDTYVYNYPTSGSHTFQLNSYYVNGAIYSTTNGGGVQRDGYYTVNLSRILPKNVKLLNALVSFRWTSVGANMSTTSNQMQFNVNVYRTSSTRKINTVFTTPSNTLAYTTGTPTGLDAVVSNYTTSFTAPDTTEKVASLNLSSYNLYNNNSQDIILEIDIRYLTTGSSATSNYILSPILVKYSH